ncbi:hypothetical protein FA95DRAFT_1567848 [Auriscalpium vulgare]|uniref:Uncharacterized protein n=1 Tax=Auriscalpium vulgare TaxID=40419 RepID=A0ACB8R3E2_9AGAM|nr:hypothetical protein FA95DRAFT_1567848 [Auriscalpium vulgare]
MNDLCLAFVERCLGSYDIDSLLGLAATEQQQVLRELVQSLVLHPGFEVLQQFLTTSPLKASILSYLVDRIIVRVLEIQDAFRNFLIPLLAETPDAPIVGMIQSRSFYTRFDIALSVDAQYAPAIATYVSFASHPDMAVLSIKISLRI